LQAGRPSWVRKVEARIEASLFEQADRVILTCAAAAQAYRERFPALADKIVTITNAFEPRVLAREPRFDRLTLIHFGNCYGARSLAPVIRALARLRDQGRLDPREDVVRNLGRIRRCDPEPAASLVLAAQLEPDTAVPYQQGLAELARADLLLLLSYGREQLFLPAKLFDYMAAGAPVLCGAPTSELTEIVAATQIGRSCDPDDVDACAAIISAAAARRRDGDAAEPLRDSSGAALQPYTAEATTAALARLLDQLV